MCVAQASVPGAKVVDLCLLGDKFINDATGKIYKSSKIEKGVGFPTCISLNNVVGHFSPGPGDATALKENDVAKVYAICLVVLLVAACAHALLCHVVCVCACACVSRVSTLWLCSAVTLACTLTATSPLSHIPSLLAQRKQYALLLCVC